MSEECEGLHNLLQKVEKKKFPFKKEEIPLNGIYILFEKNELGHKGNRIVRVGTHTGKDQLPSRLFQHFLNENKDRSIFRKNIGRAILNKNNDPFLSSWEIDLTTKKSKERNGEIIDLNRQKEIEKEVTKYIQENFEFVVFEIKDKDKRLELESKIISTVSNCKNCNPSKNWLGNFSPKEKIRVSGLWLVNELWKRPLSKNEIGDIRKLFFPNLD